MKNLTRKRLLSLLLTLAILLALAPASLAAPPADTQRPSVIEEADGGGKNDEEENEEEEGGGEEETDDGSGDRLFFALSQGTNLFDPTNGLLLTQMGNAPSIRVEISAKDKDGKTIRTHDNDHIAWTTSDSSVAEPHVLKDSAGGQETGRTFLVEGKKPGVCTITGTVTDPEGRPLPVVDQYKIIKFEVTVSGILPNSKELTIKENESKVLPACQPGTNDPFGIVYYGAAADGAAGITSNQPSIVGATGNDRNGLRIDGISAGTTVVTVTSGDYSAQITVTVEPDLRWIIEANASSIEPLKFSALEAEMARQCQEAIEAEGDKALVSITGLTVPTSQGTIYLGYKSPEDTGSGAGSALTYYAASQPRGPYIKDLTFVPNPSFAGAKAEIKYTGMAANGRTFKGKIEVTLEDTHTDLTLTTRANVPLKLSAEDFTAVCQEQTGAPLDYVVFTLPPVTEGVLYRDYKNELDYAARVTAAEEYDRKGLEDVTFVPAQGFVGTATIGYAGYSTTGSKYTGELAVKVTRPLDESIQYQDYGGGEITFRGSDFDAYSESMTGQPLRTQGWVSFTPPPASQGTLYRSWRNGRGVNVADDPGSFTLRQLDAVTFVAASGFDGVVRIPFAGEDRYGAAFSGTVELHIESAAPQNGDIAYTCRPSQSVKLQVTDFANLCQALTGQRLYYVSFQALPDFTQGSLFYNRTSSGVIGQRVSTAAKYFNSAAPYLNNVSFWASANFRSVEIPFTLASVDGQTFTGLLVISSGEGAGGGRAGTVAYTTSGRQPVTFRGADFDAVSRQAANAALQYLRFSLPNSSQGILYYDYREGAAPTAFNPDTTLYLTGDASIEKVTFIPASGFTGVVSIPFTAAAINGTTFQSTVEVTVRSGAAYGSIVRYSTGGAPVHLQGTDFIAASGAGQPASIRLTGLPSASQGRLYYQYVSPTQYSWLGSTTTSYSVTGDPSVSNLTFVPRAGYEGVVTIPYAATGYDGAASTGTIEITVDLAANSQYFDDIGACSNQTRAAVDYLSSQGIVNGMSYRKYEPDASILRGDFCLMLSRAFRFSVSGTGQGFRDVPAGHYYTQAIQEMYALGVVNGVGGGFFQPEETITRQDAAVMVRRALDKAGLTLPEGSGEAALANYKDRDQTDAYARSALGALVRAGLFPVTGDRLSPKAPITRADMALLLHRAVTNFS